VDINRHWDLRDENRWLDALNRYWVTPTVSKILDTEQFMDSVGLKYIRRLDTQEWYDFLNKYFGWKFMGNHPHERLMDRDKNSLEHLYSVKRSLAAIDELDLADSRKFLNLVKSPGIRGAGLPGCIGSASTDIQETDIQGMVRNR